jgi:hypothetical protein
MLFVLMTGNAGDANAGLVCKNIPTAASGGSAQKKRHLRN